jgi:hypothetical protein
MAPESRRNRPLFFLWGSAERSKEFMDGFLTIRDLGEAATITAT